MNDSGEPYLVVENLTVKFPTEDGLVSAVSDLSYTLELGKTLGIVGESGSGKSVSSMAVLGLHDVKRSRITGSIRVDGQEIIGLPEKQMNHLRGNEIAMIFQDAAGGAAPVLPGRRPADGGLLAAPPVRVEAGRPQEGDRGARPGGDPAARRSHRRLPAPVLGRHAAARHDRDGPDQLTRRC